jgi:hypothetical protein
MKALFMPVLLVQVGAYLILGWIHFFGRQDPHIPVSYIVLHIVAALNLLCLLLALGSILFQVPGTWPRVASMAISLPAILGVAVLFAIKMGHRWL